ncbi:hypothetical protein BCU12_12375 [Vibrio sp. 10N.261.55.A7]|nr:hypothetical protein BCU12_12375 [Vibrio sp. 10N.261.55.A7]
MCLFLTLSIGCTTTEYITEYKDRLVIPPAAYLTQCDQPFYEPPKTYGEAVTRDPVWFSAWRTCADQLDLIRRFYGFDVTPL